MDIKLDELKEKLDDEEYYSKLPYNLNLVRWPHGETSLHWTCAENKENMTKLLLTKIFINSENFYGATPLYYAALKNSYKCIALLLKKGADPTVCSGFTGKNAYDVHTFYISTNVPIERFAEQNNKENFEKSKKRLKKSFDNHMLSRTNKLVSYKYRLYRWYMTTVTYIINHNSSSLGGIEQKDICEDAINYEKKEGKDKLIEKCTELYNDYNNNRKAFRKQTLDSNVCLFCNKKENLKRCSKCKKVLFCNNDCQKKCFPIHKLDCSLNSN